MDKDVSSPTKVTHQRLTLSEILITANRDRESICDENDLVQDALRIIRTHLGMEVAFVSEFTGIMRQFKAVDTALDNSPIKAGDSGLLVESFCQRVIDGRLPELITDAWLIPAAMELAVTTTLPVRAHLSVPIQLSNGQIFGTFCCFSSQPDTSLDQRDLAMMYAFADFVARQIERQVAQENVCKEMYRRVHTAISAQAFTIVYQPIFQINSHKILGFECLTRFHHEPQRTPDIWFAEATQVGLGTELEIAVVRKALLALQYLPEDVYISLNVCPLNVVEGTLPAVLENIPFDRMVLEVTEHTAIADYSKVTSALEPLRSRGLRLAVDDAGAGYANFRHILQLQPDLIKLDMQLIRNIDTSSKLRALATAFVSFAREVDAQVIAEGVETTLELESLIQLHVDNAQGYLLGRPMELATALTLLKSGI